MTTIRTMTLEALYIQNVPNVYADEIGDALAARKKHLQETYSYYHNIRETYSDIKSREFIEEMLNDLSCNIGVIGMVIKGKNNPESHTFNSLLKAVGIDRVRNDI